MGYRIEISISEENGDVVHIIEKVKRDSRSVSHALCRLIQAGYNQEKISKLPRMDLFQRYKIGGKCIADAILDGDISEQDVLNCFLSCKIFLEEMYSSPFLQRIVDRQKNGDIKLKMGGLDSWLQK